MATLRLRTRKDGSAYTSVLLRAEGKQSSMSFDDHANLRISRWPGFCCGGLRGGSFVEVLRLGVGGGAACRAV